MDAKKLFACFQFVFSSIFSSLLCLLCFILWTYITTDKISVHHVVNETDFHIAESGNLNLKNRSFRLQRLGDRCTASENVTLRVYVAISITFLDQQRSVHQFHLSTYHVMSVQGLWISESRPMQAFTGRINPALRHITGILLWSRTGRPFRPRRCRSLSSVVVALLLLLSGDIESNPGPPTSKVQSNKLTSTPTAINFGSFNIRSAIRRSAIIHDLIRDERLDILALSETWICADTLDCIKRDIAPEGFSVLHVHRSGTSGRSVAGGGLAVIYRSTLDVSVHLQSERLCIS